MVIQGYRIKNTDIREIMVEINRVREKIKAITDREYHKLLSEEITFLADKVALNIIPKDTSMSIFDGAVQNIDERIRKSAVLNDHSKYNLNVFVNILPYEEYTYIKLNCQNESFIKAFKDLEEYSLTETECLDKNNQKNIVWQALHKMYKDREPMAVNLTCTTDIDREKLKFESVKMRAEIEARHSIINNILATISGGREIPPIRLMSYMDEALEIFTKNSEVKKEFNEKVMKLSELLPELNKDSNFIYEIYEN